MVMDLEIEKIQLKSDRKRICEDYLIADDKTGMFAVLDGATPLCDFVDEGGRNGAVLASRIVGDDLKTIGNASLSSKISEANRLLLDEMKKYNIDLLKKEERWSTCLAMVRFHEKEIHFAQIGDCMIFATTRTGEFLVLTTDLVFGISKRAKQQREKERLEGKTIPNEDYYKIRKNSLTYNRYMANKENGYGVLNGDPAADHFLSTGVLPIEEYRDLLLISDGLFPKDRNWDRMFSQIKKHGLDKYASDLIEYENSNNLAQDDKTGIFIKL
jgi:serine/threonine protein phosphatase PrpC